MHWPIKEYSTPKQLHTHYSVCTNFPITAVWSWLDKVISIWVPYLQLLSYSVRCKNVVQAWQPGTSIHTNYTSIIANAYRLCVVVVQSQSSCDKVKGTTQTFSLHTLFNTIIEPVSLDTFVKRVSIHVSLHCHSTLTTDPLISYPLGHTILQ